MQFLKYLILIFCCFAIYSTGIYELSQALEELVPIKIVRIIITIVIVFSILLGNISFDYFSLVYFGKEITRKSNKPPKLAEYLVYFLVPRKNRDAFLGDLDEDFQEIRKKFGLRKAKFHYWFQVLRSIPPLIGESALKMVVASITKALKTSN